MSSLHSMVQLIMSSVVGMEVTVWSWSVKGLHKVVVVRNSWAALGFPFLTSISHACSGLPSKKATVIFCKKPLHGVLYTSLWLDVI